MTLLLDTAALDAIEVGQNIMIGSRPRRRGKTKRDVDQG